MRDYEYKVIRFLIFISILFLNYHILILLTSYVAPEGFLEGVKQIGGVFYKSCWFTYLICFFNIYLFKNVFK